MAWTIVAAIGVPGVAGFRIWDLEVDGRENSPGVWPGKLRLPFTEGEDGDGRGTLEWLQGGGHLKMVASATVGEEIASENPRSRNE